MVKVFLLKVKGYCSPQNILTVSTIIYSNPAEMMELKDYKTLLSNNLRVSTILSSSPTEMIGLKGKKTLLSKNLRVSLALFLYTTSMFRIPKKN
jgi:hypothetical protein